MILKNSAFWVNPIGCLITKPIADVFNNHKTNIFKTGLFLYIANFLWLFCAFQLFWCSKDKQKTKSQFWVTLLAFFDHLDTPQSHTCFKFKK